MQIRRRGGENDEVTCFAACAFMHLARLLKPFNETRSADWQAHAELAWSYATSHGAGRQHKIYYHLQRYLLLGQAADLDIVYQNRDLLTWYATCSRQDPCNGYAEWFVHADIFMGYLNQTRYPKNATLVTAMTNCVKAAADLSIQYLNAHQYPNGSNNEGWWGYLGAGSSSFAHPCILQWKLSGEQKYIDAASQLADYRMGCNPLGKCYMVGTGFDPVADPLHDETYYTYSRGWGPIPGTHVYGPGTNNVLLHISGKQIPDVSTLFGDRKWIDLNSAITWNEMTVHQTAVHAAALYPVLAGGGAWDGSDPFIGGSPIRNDGKRKVAAPHTPCLVLKTNGREMNVIITGIAGSGAVTLKIFSPVGQRIGAYDLGDANGCATLNFTINGATGGSLIKFTTSSSKSLAQDNTATPFSGSFSGTLDAQSVSTWAGRVNGTGIRNTDSGKRIESFSTLTKNPPGGKIFDLRGRLVSNNCLDHTGSSGSKHYQGLYIVSNNGYCNIRLGK